MDLTSDQAAGLLGITGAALRQIELELKPASDRLGVRAERLYHVSTTALFKAEEPAEKPARVDPKIEPTAPPRRKDTEDRKTGPKKVRDTQAVAS